MVDCDGAYLGMGMFSVCGSAEKDHAMAHLDVRPCKTFKVSAVVAVNSGKTTACI